MQTQAMLQHEGWQDFVSVAVVIVSFKYRIEVSNSYERRVRFFIETASWTQFGRRECASWTQYSRRETPSWTQYSYIFIAFFKLLPSREGQSFHLGLNLNV